MGESHSQLTHVKRCRLRGIIEMGLAKTEMACRLGRHRSAIHRETEHNRNVPGYRPDGAARLGSAPEKDRRGQGEARDGRRS